MGFFSLFGKKQPEKKETASPDKPSSIPKIMAANPDSVKRFEVFAQKAALGEASIAIQMNEYTDLANAINLAVGKAYPSLAQNEVGSQTNAGITLKCPKCGIFNEHVRAILYLSGTGVMKNAIYGGPNIATLGQGRCPTCGGNELIVTFSPKNIQKQIATAQAEAAALESIEEAKPLTVLSPYMTSLDISPDGSLVCFAIPNGINAYESGTENLRWNLPIPAARPRLCRFVSPSRIVVISETCEKQTRLQLVEVEKGIVITEIDGPEMYYFDCDTQPEQGIFVVRSGSNQIIWGETKGDHLSINAIKVGQVFKPGPKFGPDGKCYANILYEFCRVDIDKTVPLMPGNNCIGFAQPAIAFSGSGYGDRSGESSLHIANLASGQVSEIPWGNEPIDEIFSVGKNHVLLANIVDMVNIGRFPNCMVTMLNLADQKKEWSIVIRDSKPYHEIVQAVEPEDGWALIQSGSAVKFVSLENGETLRYITKKPQEFTSAMFNQSKRLLYLTRKPGMDVPGTLECYQY
jgi:hypothetical protein